MVRGIGALLVLLVGCGSAEPWHVLRSPSFLAFEARHPVGTRASHPYARKADGCSGGRTTARKLFYTACVEHDNCYQGHDNKGQCDRAFYTNMKTLCVGDLSYLFCIGEARLMYVVVRDAAKTARVFKARQKNQAKYQAGYLF